MGLGNGSWQEGGGRADHRLRLPDGGGGGQGRHGEVAAGGPARQPWLHHKGGLGCSSITRVSFTVLCRFAGNVFKLEITFCTRYVSFLSLTNFHCQLLGLGPTYHVRLDGSRSRWNPVPVLCHCNRRGWGRVTLTLSNCFRQDKAGKQVTIAALVQAALLLCAPRVTFCMRLLWRMVLSQLP